MEPIFKPSKAAAQQNNDLTHPFHIGGAPIAEVKPLFVDNDHGIEIAFMVNLRNRIGVRFSNHPLLGQKIVARKVQNMARFGQMGKHSGAQ